MHALLSTFYQLLPSIHIVCSMIYDVPSKPTCLEGYWHFLYCWALLFFQWRWCRQEGTCLASRNHFPLGLSEQIGWLLSLGDQFWNLEWCLYEYNYLARFAWTTGCLYLEVNLLLSGLRTLQTLHSSRFSMIAFWTTFKAFLMCHFSSFSHWCLIPN